MSVESKLARGMTAADLIAELKNYPDDAVVGFASDYGDHCHTMQFLPVTVVRENERNEFIVKNEGYSKSGLEVREIDYDNDEDADPDAPNGPPRTVVVILE